MFKKIVTLILLLPVISALQLNMPSQALTSEGQFTITWSTASGDPATFDLELDNESFHKTYAIKATVQTADGTLTLTMPVVEPGDGYSFQASMVGNINNVLSKIGPFNIGAAVSSTSTSSSTAVSSSSGSGVSSTSPLVGGPPSSTGSGFGRTISSSSQPSGTPGTQTSTSSSTSGTPTGTGGGSTFNSASNIAPGGFIGSVALLAAGAAFIGL